jgi:integrase
MEWGYIARNPFVPAAWLGRRGRDSSPLRVRAKSRPWQHITPDEFLRFWAAVPDVRRRAAFWLMYGCGLRPGEVYNLTADKIDLPGREVHVENREATPDVPPVKIKCAERSDDSKERLVPIPEAAVSDLTEVIRLSFTSGGFVVLTGERYHRVREAWRRCQGGEPWGPSKVVRPWQNEDMINNVLRGTKRALRRAGIELTAPFKLNTFRKSFAQNHADNGTPPKTLVSLLGHSDTQITMQFYNRVTDANVREAARTINRLFATDREGRNAG